MRYGIREICNVVLRAKGKMTVGNKTFYKDEPVIYFDSLKTSSLEGASTTVYATGGRGNTRLIAWEGERTVTFTMEDALISNIGLAILAGADVIAATSAEPITQHVTEQVEVGASDVIKVSKKPYQNGSEHLIYVMKLDGSGNVDTEPYIYTGAQNSGTDGKYVLTILSTNYTADLNQPAEGDIVLVDYYTQIIADATQINITPETFGGNFYLEAETLFRDTNGVDMPAEFIIPNCKIQSNFTFTMASSGDPSTFTFTMDAFPDYTRFNRTKKVLSAIQIIEENQEGAAGTVRTSTAASAAPAPDAIFIGGDSSIAVGERARLVAALSPIDAAATITWAVTSGDTYASVDADGIVTGLEAGSVTITATATNGAVTKTATHSITVTAAEG